MFYLRYDSNSRNLVPVRIGKIEENYKIEVFNPGQYPTPGTYWRITDDKGIIYEFGTHGEEGCEMRAGSNPRYVTTWNITKIIHPINGCITFNYSTENSTITPTLYDIHSYTKYYGSLEYYDDRDPVYTPVDYDYGYKIDFIEKERLKYHGVPVQIYKPYLKSITTDDCMIVFNLSDRRDLRGSQRIDEIQVKNVLNKVVRDIKFSYSIFDDQIDFRYMRLKLEKVSIGQEEYKFEYNQTSLPPKNSYAQDFWGYFNGKYSNKDLVPKTKIELINGLSREVSYSDAIIGTANRFADESNAKAGILNKIYYPTKGYTKFEYELNSFDNSDDFVLRYGYMDAFNADKGAGLRIKTVTNYDYDNRMLEQTRYDYKGGKLIVPLNNVEKEKLLFLRRKRNSEAGEGILRWFYTATVSSSPRTPLFTSLMCSPIGYDEVSITRGHIKIVKFFGNSVANTRSWDAYVKSFNGKKYEGLESRYRSWIDINDDSPYLSTLHNGIMSEQYTIEKNDRDSVWINDIVYYNRGDEMSSSFDTMSAKSFKCVDLAYCGLFNNPKLIATPLYRIVALPYLSQRINLLKKKEYNFYYNNTGDFVDVGTTTQYEYNRNNLISQKTIIESSKSDTIVTNYDYTTNSYMLSKNMYAYPEIITEKVNGKTVSVSKNEYSLVNFKPVLTKCMWSDNGMTFHDRIAYKYDSNGNVVQAQKYDGVPVSYLWAYNGTLPVVKVVGMEYSRLKNIIENQCDIKIDKLKTASGDVDGLLSIIRNCNLLNGYATQLFTYTYEPLVGITKEIGPNGEHTHYRYDTSGRLVEILDGNYSTVKKFEYHFRY